MITLDLMVAHVGRTVFFSSYMRPALSYVRPVLVRSSSAFLHFASGLSGVRFLAFDVLFLGLPTPLLLRLPAYSFLPAWVYLA